MDDKGKTPIDFGSWGHRSRSTLCPARGYHALHCLVGIASQMTHTSSISMYACRLSD